MDYVKGKLVVECENCGKIQDLDENNYHNMIETYIDIGGVQKYRPNYEAKILLCEECFNSIKNHKFGFKLR